MNRTLVKFKIGHLPSLREKLLRDTTREWFGMAMGNMEKVGNTRVITIKRVRIFSEAECESQTIAYVRPTREAVRRELVTAQQRGFNTLLDIHSHPFSITDAWFSATDTNDETRFAAFLHKEVGGISTFGSLVFSREKYNGRMWLINNQLLNNPSPLEIRVPVYTDAVPPCHSIPWQKKTHDYSSSFAEDGLLNRNVRALGLDGMKRIVDNQRLVVIGAGSIGSIFTETAVQSGFNSFVLVDHDIVEHSNLSRLAGATIADVRNRAKKVDVLKRLIRKNINPKAKVKTLDADILKPPVKLLEEIATAQWLVIATDSASSRFECVKLAMRFHTPYISMGVNISVAGGRITDESGEVIIARPGDNICHLCLGRVDHTKIAQESHPDKKIREELIKRGYVTGADIKSPMVKPVNSIIANLGVEVLINQYTRQKEHKPVWVYENNRGFEIYADDDSVLFRKKNCALCSA